MKNATDIDSFRGFIQKLIASRKSYWRWARKTATRLTVVLVAGLLNCAALDITTLDGKTYKDCRVSKVDPDSIVILCSSGGARIYFNNLPPDLQEKHGYNPDKAAAFAAEEVARKQREREAIAAQQATAAVAAKKTADAARDAEARAYRNPTIPAYPTTRSVQRSESVDTRPKTVRVGGYTKRDGTYVAPHTRRAPRR